MRQKALLAGVNGHAGTKKVAVTLAVETDNQAVRAVRKKTATWSRAMAVRQLGFMRRVLDPQCLQLKTTVQQRLANHQSRILTKWFERPLHMRAVLRVCATWNVAPQTLRQRRRRRA